MYTCTRFLTFLLSELGEPVFPELVDNYARQIFVHIGVWRFIYGGCRSKPQPIRGSYDRHVERL